MSGTVGGTLFNLGINIPEFKNQFAQARAAAQAGSKDIADTLNEINTASEKAAQQIYNSINRALGRGGALTKYAELKDASVAAKAALQDFASGSTEEGFTKLSRVADDLTASLDRINDRTEVMRKRLGGKNNDAAESALKYYAAQATTLKQALDQITGITGKSGNALTTATVEEERQQRIAMEQQVAIVRKNLLLDMQDVEKQILEQRKANEANLKAREKAENEIIQQQQRAAEKAAAEQRQMYEQIVAIRRHNAQQDARDMEKEIAEQRQATEKRLADQRKAYEQQLKEQQKAAESSGSNLGDNILTGLGIGSGMQLTYLAISKVQQLLGQLKQGAIDFNDALDQSTIAWTTFTGSAAKANEQVKILFNFSKVTPFTFQEVDAAARLLAAFGGAAFASTENLKLLGNVAAGTKQPLNNIAYEFGQIYTEIENGLPFGRAARALVQFGALTGEARVRMEEMQKAGVDQHLILEVLYKDLGRFSGQLEAQSKTWSGALTTAKDSLMSLEAVANRPLFDKLKASLNEVNKLLNSDELSAAARLLAVFSDLYANYLETLVISIKGFILGTELLVFNSLNGMVKALNVITQGSYQSQVDFLTKVGNQLNADTKALGEQGKTNAQKTVDDLKAIFTGSFAKAGKDSASAFGEGWQDNIKNVIAKLNDDMQAQAELSGLAASRSYLYGFSQANFSQLKDLQDVVANAIFGSKSSGKLKADAADLIGSVRPLLVAAISDINDYGKVADDTFSQNSDVLNTNIGTVQKLQDTLGALKSALPPDAYQAVKEYLDGVKQLGDAQTQLAFATAHLSNEQDNLAAVQDRVTAATKTASDEVDRLTKIQQDNADTNQKVIDGIRDHIQSLQEDAKASADSWNNTIKGLRTELDGLQATADENAKKFSAMLEPLNKEQERLTTIAKQNADIYRAVLAGTTQDYLAQNEILDEQTRKIAAKWEAEIGGKRRASEGSDAKVTSLEQSERKEVLALEERIRAARAAHNDAQAAALTREQERVKARYAYQLDLARQQAAVAKDNLDNAAKGLTKEADQQAAKDKAAEDANKKQIDAITEQAKAQKALDDAAIAAKNTQIKQVQEQADADKAAFDARISVAEKEQTAAEKHKKTQEDEDKARTEAAKDHLKEIKDQGDLDLEYAKKKVNAAKDAADQAKAEYDAAKKVTDTIKDRLAFIQQENDLYLNRINASRADQGLPPLTWEQILAGNYPQGGINRGIGEGRQDPTAAASGAPVPGGSTPKPAPAVPSPSPSPAPSVPVGPQPGPAPSPAPGGNSRGGDRLSALRINPGASLSALALPPSSNYSTTNAPVVSSTDQSVTIQAINFFPGSNISKDVDLEAAAKRAGNIFLQEIKGQILGGGSVNYGAGI